MKNLIDKLEEYFVEHSLETECSSGGTHIEHIVHRAKQWALEMVGEDFPDSEAIARAEDPTVYQCRLTHNMTLAQIRKRIEDSTKTQETGGSLGTPTKTVRL